MSVTAHASASKSPFRYGNPAIRCDGAEIHTLCKQMASVMSITGRVDGANVDCLSERAGHCVIPEKAFVLDLTGVQSFAKQAVGLLDAIDTACEDAGVEWAIVADPAIAQALRVAAEDARLPIAGSVPEALQHFSDAVGARRRLLPLLTKSA